MGASILMKTGGSSSSDDCTATLSNVLEGYTAITSDSDDEAAAGTMVNRGAGGTTLNCGGSYAIPEGYYDGTGVVKVNSLSSQTSGTATAARILSGYTAWVSGTKLTGTIASLAGGTYTPKSSSQTISCSGKYMTSNVVISGDSNLTAANIVKGKSIFGVSGTAKVRGVPGSGDLYYYGQQVVTYDIGSYFGYSNACICTALTTCLVVRMTGSGSCNICFTGSTVNLGDWSKINIRMIQPDHISDGDDDVGKTLRFSYGTTAGSSSSYRTGTVYISIATSTVSLSTWSIDISDLTGSYYVALRIVCDVDVAQGALLIERIWLS